MNEPLPQPPSDSELDRLLAGRLRRTSPDFELRWRKLRAEFVDASRRTPHPWTKWLLLPGLATVAVAALVFALFFHSPVSPARGGTAATFEELLSLNDALQPATALLDAETRDALLHLPPPSKL